MTTASEGIKIHLRNLADRGYKVELGKYAPGDGWTRYSVSINGWTDIRQGMTARECEAYLQGMFDLLRIQRDAEMSRKTA